MTRSTNTRVNRERRQALIQAAADYQQRGWKPVFIPGNGKNPTDRDWQNTDYRDHHWRPWDNIGVQLGAKSAGLCDVDLDCREALRLADHFLPDTAAMFGRRSKPRSHRLFVSDLYETEDKNAATFHDIDGAMLLELRTGGAGKGAVSMFPPSRHPDSRQIVEWDADDEPAQIRGDELKQRVSDLAVATLLLRHYRNGGGRHEAFLVLGGVLARAGFAAEDIKSFVKHVATAAGDEEVDNRIEAAVSAVERLARHEDTPGLPRFAEVWGPDVAERAMQWLGLSDPTHRAGPRSRSNIHSWEDPDTSLLDDRRGVLPIFPFEVLKSSGLKEWAEQAARGSGTVVDHVMVPLLGIAGGLIGASRRVQASKTWTMPMTLWTAVVGFSGTGKTPGLDVSRVALDVVEHDHQAENQAKQKDYEQQRDIAKVAREVWKAAVKKAQKEHRQLPPMPPEAETPKPFIPPRLYVSDPTIEAMAYQLQARPQGMLLVTDELARLFLNISRYSTGQDNEFWLEAWDGKPYHQVRIGREPVDLQHLLIGIVGGLQPDKLALSFKGAADGMYARMLFAWPETAPFRRLTDAIPPLATEVLKIFNTLAYLADRPRGRNVPLSDNARTVFDRLRREVHDQADSLDGREREWWAKLPAHTLRLAGVLAYLYWTMNSAENQPEPEGIMVEDMKSAITLARDYFWPHAQAALRQVGLSDQHLEARRVLNWTAANGKEVISREEIRCEALSKRLDANATQQLLDQLERAGWLRKNISPTGGRPSVRWSVNPRLLGGGEVA